MDPSPEDVYRVSGDEFPSTYVRKKDVEPLQEELAYRIQRL